MHFLQKPCIIRLIDRWQNIKNIRWCSWVEIQKFTNWPLRFIWALKRAHFAGRISTLKYPFAGLFAAASGSQVTKLWKFWHRLITLTGCECAHFLPKDGSHTCSSSRHFCFRSNAEMRIRPRCIVFTRFPASSDNLFRLAQLISESILIQSFFFTFFHFLQFLLDCAGIFSWNTDSLHKSYLHIGVIRNGCHSCRLQAGLYLATQA